MLLVYIKIYLQNLHKSFHLGQSFQLQRKKITLSNKYLWLLQQPFMNTCGRHGQFSFTSKCFLR